MSKTKMKPVEKDISQSLLRMTLIGFAVLLFYPPFFRGLFFQVEQQWTLFFAALVFFICCLWKISKEDFRLFSGFQSYLVLGFFAVYVIASFGAADVRLAVAEIVKTGIYLVVFWVAGQLAREKNSSALIITVLYLGGVAVAFSGFLCAVGLLPINGGFVNGRMSSTLQYPNTLAIYLAAMSFFGFTLWLTGWLTGSSERHQLCLAVGNFILMFVFASTISRGGFLVFGGMVVLYFLGLPREMKIPWLGHIACIIPLAVICAAMVIPAAYNHKNAAAWLWFLACLAAVIAINWIGRRVAPAFRSKLKGFSTKKVAVSVLICIIVAAGAYLCLGNQGNSTQASAGSGEQSQAGPIARLSNFSLETRNAQLRINWALQAFTLVKERPVLGMGGGGWEAAYRQFQDYPYSSTQVHNHFLQVWVEVGTVGLLLYLAVWVLFIITCWKNYRSAPSAGDKVFELMLFVSGIGLGVHSLIDFDLSLSAVAIVLWTCFGLAWGRFSGPEASNVKEKDKGRQQRQVFIIGTSLLSLCFLGLSGSLLVAHAYENDGIAYAQAGNINKAESSFLRASRFDPFSSEIKQTLASISNAKGDKTGAVNYMNEALEGSSYNYLLYSALSKIYLNQENAEAAIEAGKAAVNSAPWTVPAYESLTEAYAKGGVACMRQGDLEGARSYFTECSSLPELLHKNEENLSDSAQKIWINREEFFELNSRINMNIGIAQLYLEKYSEAQVNLTKAFKDEKTKSEAGSWLLVLAKKTGEASEVQKLLQAADENTVKQIEGLAALTAVSKTP